MARKTRIAVPAFASDWARKLEVNPASITRLTGGINSEVYSCGEGQRRFVIKRYLQTSSTHNRMRAELEFLRFAEKVAPQYVPSVIAADESHQCLVMTFLYGESFPTGSSPTHQDVQVAIDFFKRLVSHKETARSLVSQNAAEGFLKLSEHLKAIEARIESMKVAHLPKACQSIGRELLNQLKEVFQRLSASMSATLHADASVDQINPALQIVSPSDFGFHNAIRTLNGVCFIDFEFAGWDDPTKAVVDFVLQPRVPVLTWPSPLLDAFEAEERSLLTKRSNLMYPVLTLKWACIIGSVLGEDRLLKLTETLILGNGLEDLLRSRINHAMTYLLKDSACGLH